MNQVNNSGYVQDIYAEKAMSLIEEGSSLFITGKAGTGKTTLLRNVVTRAVKRHKNIVVLSPTGVAAKNADGVTIHSFLHLPLSPYIPGMRVRGLYNLNLEESTIVNRVDMIIIDEISMVRCDLLDEVDDVLRHYRNNSKPFGGVQMVFIGDLYQLMPVAEEDEWNQLKDYYESSYFFSSKVYSKMKCPMFELKKVHRQQNLDFIDLLNKVRRGVVTPTDMKMLMSRYRKADPNEKGIIRLTTHNWRANAYNANKLEELPSEEYEFKAYIEGWFPSEDYPTKYRLYLKRGARVMFVRNDNIEGKYVNGSLGTVTSLSPNSVQVQLDDGNIIIVEKQRWDKYRYHINRLTKVIETIKCGSFTQYPLKLAWAVTIHKSQGLTFDKVVIDAGKAFTYGQVYVALSRCRTFKGITLVSEIKEKIVKSDPVVERFMKETKQIVIKGVEESKSNTKGDPIPSTLKWTRMMVKDGLTIKEMIAQSGEREEIIYSHLAKLIEIGEANVHKYIEKKIYTSIKKVIYRLGTDARLQDIKSLCDSQAKYGEIRMVIAEFKYHKSQNKKQD